MFFLVGEDVALVMLLYFINVHRFNNNLILKRSTPYLWRKLSLYPQAHLLTVYPGSKKRHEEEEKTRIADNQYVAGSSYKTPGPEDLGNEDPTGLPWGSVSLRPVFEGGKGKEKQSQYSSREASSTPSKTSSSRG